MWRDIARRALARGLESTLPAPYPLEGFDLANQVAVLAAREGWCPPYAKAFYRRWFRAGIDPSHPVDRLAAFIDSVGQNSDRVLKAARVRDVEDAYHRATDEARGLGVFGAPSFVVDGEVFWGDDRMEDAIVWRTARH